MERLQGIVERITFQSEESGYTVAKLQPEGSGEEVTVVGTTLSLTAGECVALDGEWTDHARYGRQFKIESYEKVYPSTVHGMRKYLGSGLIKGIGPVMAGRIVDHFGKKTLEVIEKASKRLVEVEGLGRKRARMIEDAWKEQREIHQRDAVSAVARRGHGAPREDLEAIRAGLGFTDSGESVPVVPRRLGYRFRHRRPDRPETGRGTPIGATGPRGYPLRAGYRGAVRRARLSAGDGVDGTGARRRLKCRTN